MSESIGGPKHLSSATSTTRENINAGAEEHQAEERNNVSCDFKEKDLKNLIEKECNENQNVFHNTLDDNLKISFSNPPCPDEILYRVSCRITGRWKINFHKKNRGKKVSQAKATTDCHDNHQEINLSGTNGNVGNDCVRPSASKKPSELEKTGNDGTSMPSPR